MIGQLAKMPCKMFVVCCSTVIIVSNRWHLLGFFTVACKKNGMHFTGLVKTATRMFPKQCLDEVEFKLTSSVEGHNIMAHAWGDKVRKCFRSRHSTTLPGNPSNKRRWRDMLDEDGEEVGQTEVFNKTVKRKKVVESYFNASLIIDINNHMRQGGLALETAWRTQSWTNRVVAAVLGIVETDACLLYKKFHPGCSMLSHSDFTEAVAKALQMQISISTQANHRKRLENQNEQLLHNFVLLKIIQKVCTATYASRLCSVCRSPCKKCCSVCSDASNGKIVALCGLRSKQGSSCLVKHIIL